MNPKLLALKLFLDELGTEPSIDTFDDRKRVQKAVFLGQVAGADLAYRFGWYRRGPYCPELTKDYYALADAASSGDLNPEKKVLRKPFREQLQKLRPLLTQPQDLPLQQEDWLELVASYHFLRKVSRLSREDAEKVFEREKPRLRIFIPAAELALQQYNLL